MSSAVLQPHDARWLLENAPKELALLLRAVTFHSPARILIVDDDRRCRQASFGAGKLWRSSSESLIESRLDDLIEPGFRPRLSVIWETFLRGGEQEGRLPVGSGGSVREIEYMAKAYVLPTMHLFLFSDDAKSGSESEFPIWTRDYAFLLLHCDGTLAAWYGGAQRMFGYSAAESVGHHMSLLYPSEDHALVRRGDELKRSSEGGHFATEGWRVKKDGERFWANTITLSLRDEKGNLQGFAALTRDFTGKSEREKELRKMSQPLPRWPEEITIPGIASGEFDRIPEANDSFLDMTGYTREDLSSGSLRWPALTAPEYEDLDEVAHEEGLRFGACTPYEKELIRRDGTRLPVVVATAVLKLSPFRWITFVQDLREQKPPRVDNSAEPERHAGFEEIVGRGAALNRLLVLVELVAPTNATVLILGETGTGKELVARAVHRRSPRRDRPFITLNCAAIPTGLLESELFGYERGAFTGALSQKIGRFEMAHRGTLFLDEVGDIPLDLQPKLLRALQEKTFERLGGTRTIPIDVRLVAATNRNLTQMMGEKLFRSDLYYRLRVFPITTPPLRDHAEDIPALVRHFTQKYAREMNKQIDKIPAETMRALVAWTWPGNVRELENFVERAVILSPGSYLRGPLAEIEHDDMAAAGDATLEHMEKQYIIRTLRELGGVVSKAATRLGIPRTTLNALMRKLGISRKDI